MRTFTSKTILITGAGSGIGRATAEQLAEEGAALMLVDVSAEGLAAASESIASKFGTAVSTITADVTRDDDVDRYVDATLEQYGRIDGFFNNAGIEAPAVMLEDIEIADFERLLSVNLVGAFRGIRRVLAVMHEQGHGAVVNMSSVTGLHGAALQSAYAASKHGIAGLTRSAALEYGQFGIRINAVAPGGILTPMAERAMRRAGGDDWQSLIPAAASVNPMKRLGQTSDISVPVAFLLSDEAAFINGVVLTIDGGQSVST